MSDQPHLLVERDGHVLVLTMNRPEAKNALSSEMMAGMSDAWDELNEDPAAHFAGAQMPFRLRQPLGRETTIDVLEQILFRDAAHGSRPQVARDATAVYTTKDGL